MMIMVTGISSSGKSEIAEDIAVKLQGDSKLYYIATMHTYDDEGVARVNKHRALRAEKHFTTIEQFVDVQDINIEEDSTCLIECMSNLVANEMYDVPNKSNIVDKVMENLLALRKSTMHLIIVTNEVFSDGNEYDESCREYIDNLGRINQRIALNADCVIESVVGIPIIWKGEI